MTRDPLLDDLRGLPQETASPGFTSRVLAGLSPSVHPRHRLTLAAVMVMAVAGIAAGWWYGIASTRRDDGMQQMRRELAAMQAEHQRLKADWKELRRLEARTEPILHLQGNDNLDLILDLRQVPPGAVRVEVEPAAIKQRSPL